MTNGGLPDPRIDQRTDPTPRTVAAGQRILQVANNRTGLPLTVQISIPNPRQANAVAGDGATVQLVAAAANTSGLLLWSIAISSFVGATADPGIVTIGTDLVQGTGGTVYLGLVTGLAAKGNVPASISQDMWGFPVAAGFGLNLVAASVATAHTVIANVSYSLLTA